MKLPKHVRILSWPLSKIFRGMAFIDKIYLRKDIYRNLSDKKPACENVGILIHEETHLRRIKKSNFVLH